MTYDPVAGSLAVELTRRATGSARPDAPVVADRAPRPARTRSARARVAAELRALARWVEPNPCASQARQAG